MYLIYKLWHCYIDYMVKHLLTWSYVYNFISEKQVFKKYESTKKNVWKTKPQNTDYWWISLDDKITSSFYTLLSNFSIMYVYYLYNKKEAK